MNNNDVLATLTAASRWIEEAGSGEAPELARDVREARDTVESMAAALRKILPVVESLQPVNNMTPLALKSLSRWANEARYALARIGGVA